MQRKVTLTKNMLVAKSIFEDLGDVFYVGGCVRDAYYGVHSADIDLCTPCSPQVVKNYLNSKDIPIRNYAKKYGNFEIFIKDITIHITTFRKESYSKGSIYPEIIFTNSIDDDLKRRDLTINSIVCDLQGFVYDPYKGLEDLENKIIKAIDANQEFFNDPIRILRAIRFCAKYNAHFEGITLDYIKKHSYRLKKARKTKIKYEIERMFDLTNPEVALGLLFDIGIFRHIFPLLFRQYNYDQNNPNHSHFLHDHTLFVVKNLRKDIKRTDPDFYNKLWVALFHDIAKPVCRKEKANYSVYPNHAGVGSETVKTILKGFGFDLNSINYIASGVATHLDKNFWLRKYDNMSK